MICASSLFENAQKIKRLAALKKKRAEQARKKKKQKNFALARKLLRGEKLKGLICLTK
jgi:hypothetical protein